MIKTEIFENDGTEWSAWRACQAWLKEHGYDHGSMQRDAPIGVHRAPASISKWRNMTGDERASLDGRIEWLNGGPRNGTAMLRLGWGPADESIPVERWGKDHWSTFAFVAYWCAESGGGFDIKSQVERMRCDPGRHPEHANTANRLSPETRYPTRLRDGEKLEAHDDWDCVEDAIAAGLVEDKGSGWFPLLFMSDAGLEMAAKLTAHKTKGGNFGDFAP